jgi:hypothetical protein
MYFFRAKSKTGKAAQPHVKDASNADGGEVAVKDVAEIVAERMK